MTQHLDTVIVVTGANGAIGFGICHRLLVQLSLTKSRDAYLGTNEQKINTELGVSFNSITLYMVCRDLAKAQEAKAKLLRALKKSLDGMQRTNSSDGLSDKFIELLDIRPACVDLTETSSIIKFVKGLEERHGYISHLICNAGMAPFIGVDSLRATKEMFLHPMKALTTPEYVIQSSGTLSKTGYGLVWLTNTFGPYMLYRLMLTLLESFHHKSRAPSRVVWVSTLNTDPRHYDPSDIQLLRSSLSYEGSKYEIELISAHLNETQVKVKHFIVQPGIIGTTLDKPNSRPGRAQFRAFSLFMARLFKSPNHPSSPYKGAVSAVHACLVPLSAMPAMAIKINAHTAGLMSVREYISYTTFDAWTGDEKKRAKDLIDQLDKMHVLEVERALRPEGEAEKLE